NHRELTCYCLAGTLGPASSSDGHSPGAKLRRLAAARHQRRGRLVEQMAKHIIARVANLTGPINLSGLVRPRRPSDVCADGFGGFEAGRIVHRHPESEASDRSDARHGHQPQTYLVLPGGPCPAACPTPYVRRRAVPARATMAQ